jgi:hypothetical protein
MSPTCRRVLKHVRRLPVVIVSSGHGALSPWLHCGRGRRGGAATRSVGPVLRDVSFIPRTRRMNKLWVVSADKGGDVARVRLVFSVMSFTLGGCVAVGKGPAAEHRLA